MRVNIIDNLTAAFGAVLSLRSGWMSVFLYKDYKNGEVGLAGPIFFGCLSLLGFRLVPAGYVGTVPTWMRVWRLIGVMAASISLELFYMELQEGHNNDEISG